VTAATSAEQTADFGMISGICQSKQKIDASAVVTVKSMVTVAVSSSIPPFRRKPESRVFTTRARTQ